MIPLITGMLKTFVIEKITKKVKGADFILDKATKAATLQQDIGRAERPDQTAWISVKNSLPECYVDVVVTWEGMEEAEIDYLDVNEAFDRHWVHTHETPPTHWYPIPKPLD